MGLSEGCGQLAARRVDGRLYVARSGIDIAVQLELHDDRRRSEKLVEVISVTPAMRPNWRSSGVATADAMVSGLAPGSAADTEMVGNSTCGRRRDRQEAISDRCPPARAPASAESWRSAG